MSQRNSEVVLRAARRPDDYLRLIEIWRSAVLATHNFLAASDFQRIESNLASAYFPAVTLTVAERDGETVGFAGTADGTLEMLFVSDDVRSSGIGSQLLAHVIAKEGVTKVDVNDQNSGAHGFYLSRGFTEVSRSELDSDGRPYPILHLALQA